MKKTDITIPALGESINEATVGALLKAEGSSVKVQEELMEIETDKVNQLVYAPSPGIVHWQIKTGDKVQSAAVVGWIEEVVTTSLKEEPSPPLPPATKQPSADVKVEKEVGSSFTAPLPKQETKAKRTPLSPLRQTKAKRLIAVKNETAMLTTFNEVDMHRLIEIRKAHQEAFQKKHGVKLGYMGFFIKATISALKSFPQILQYIEGNDLVSFEGYHIAVAVSTDRGLTVPVIQNCDLLTLAQIEQQVAEKAEKARKGTLSLEELKNGGFTITNGGIFGSLFSTPILNPPQSAILGMHAITKRVVAIEDKVEIRPMMYVALSYDHRVIDGKEAVQFLGHIKSHIECPEQLLLELG